MAVTINVLRNITNLMRKTRTTFYTELTEVYKPAIYNRQKELMDVIKEKVELAGRSQVAGKLRVAKEYYKLEMAPPSGKGDLQILNEQVKLIQDFFKTGAVKYLTVKQVFLIFVISLEVSLWFFLGETIGKGHIIGYKV